jgi:DHA1 family tetracycline resistance protein-like MFS transporter
VRKPSVLVVFLTVFLDLIGFGIVLPLLPLYAQEFGASGFLIGAIQASFSAMQFIFAPLWGRLSDRIGRRPVLLVSTAGSAISYAVFAVGSGLSGQSALWVLLGSRALAFVAPI